MAFRQDNSLHNSITALRCDIQEILQSGKYYTTEEIAKELSVIKNALDHLSLDNTFLATSKDWQQKPGNYTTNQIAQHYAGVHGAINNVCVNLLKIKQNFCNENVAYRQENQLRELHQWAMSSLRESQKRLEPYTVDAADRIKQFGDTLGVTDRYTSYRNNLTRGNREPVRMQTSWMNKSGDAGFMNNLTRSHTTIGTPSFERQFQTRTVQFSEPPAAECTQFGGVPPANIGALKKEIRFGSANPPMRITRGYRTIDSLYPKPTAPLSGGPCTGSSVIDEVKTLNTLNANDLYGKMDRFNARSAMELSNRQPYQNWSVQEQVGINMTFPGKSEYMIQFKMPSTEEKISDFKINPTPNFGIYGRPMEISCFMPSFTEYQTRYEWPDGSKIEKRPWLRN